MGLDVAVYIYTKCNVGILLRFDSMLSTLTHYKMFETLFCF